MPAILAAAMALEAFSPVALTGAAAPVFRSTVLMFCEVAYESSK